MTDELPYRAALACLAAAAGGVSAYFRRRAATAGERVTWEAEGRWFAVTLRLAGAALGVATLCYLFGPEWLRTRPAFLPGIPPGVLPTWLRWVGVAIGAPAVFFQYWTLANLGDNLTDTVVVRRRATLVTHGPYRWIRHPFYSAAGMLILSASLISSSPWIAASGLAVLGLLVVRTSHEERRLLERFGDEYRRYAERTGRFWPRRRRTDEA